MMRRLVALVLGLGLAAGLAWQASVAVAQGQRILQFDSMVGVSGPFLGATNAIRGVSGAGAPWSIARADGELRKNGELDVRVRGLVRADGPNAGTNTNAAFRGLVSCLSVSAGQVVTVNVSTQDFPADPAGDSRIRTNLTLPDPCVAPIIFVTNTAGRWFAVTGA